MRGQQCIRVVSQMAFCKAARRASWGAGGGGHREADVDDAVDHLCRLEHVGGTPREHHRDKLGPVVGRCLQEGGEVGQIAMRRVALRSAAVIEVGKWAQSRDTAYMGE